MFDINKEDLTISITRGDEASFFVSATDDSEGEAKPYVFKPGDVVRINVHEKKNCEKVYIQKDFPIGADTEKVEIYLSGEETKIGEIISKPKEYWYEISLNPDTDPQTIIGYDKNGAKLFMLYPEGGEFKKEGE